MTRPECRTALFSDGLTAKRDEASRSSPPAQLKTQGDRFGWCRLGAAGRLFPQPLPQPAAGASSSPKSTSAQL